MRRCANVMCALGCLLATALTMPSAQAQPFAAGLRTVAVGDSREPNLLAWYPSTGQATRLRLGPYTLSAARNGRVAAGRHPVILFSHGWAGRARDHAVTAARLARAGFIVLVPQHVIAWYVPVTVHLTARLVDFHTALAWAKSHPELGAALDPERIGAAGYSFGGLTALALAGGTPDSQLARSHCAVHKAHDAQFCRSVWRQRVWRLAAALIHGDRAAPPPLTVRAIVLVAPVGAAFDAASLRGVDAAVSIHRFGADELLRYPYHAAHLRALIKMEEDDYHVYEQAGHYAFIDPLPQWFVDQQGGKTRAAMHNPAGFDRAALIAAVGREMARFFARRLVVKEAPPVGG